MAREEKYKFGYTKEDQGDAFCYRKSHCGLSGYGAHITVFYDLDEQCSAPQPLISFDLELHGQSISGLTFKYAQDRIALAAKGYRVHETFTEDGEEIPGIIFDAPNGKSLDDILRDIDQGGK